MEKMLNFSLSPSGHSFSRTGNDFSLLRRESHFDAKANTARVLADVLSSVKPSDSLLFSAAAALQRQANRTESDEAWAERLSKTFFDGLDT